MCKRIFFEINPFKATFIPNFSNFHVQTNFVPEIGLKILFCHFKSVDLQNKGFPNFDRPANNSRSQNLACLQQRLHIPALKHTALYGPKLAEMLALPFQQQNWSAYI